MKRIFIFSIASILALSLVALAGTQYYEAANGATSFNAYLRVVDSGNSWDYNDAPALANYTYYYTTDGNALSTVAEVTTLANYNSAWSSGGAKASGKGGLLRFCVPDACMRAGIGKNVYVTVIDANGGDRIDAVHIKLKSYEPNTGRESVDLGSVDGTASDIALVTSTDVQTQSQAALTAQGLTPTVVAKINTADTILGKFSFTGSGPYWVDSEVKGQDDIDFGATQKASLGDSNWTDALLTTTVSAATSKSAFTLADGSAAAGAYINNTIRVTDANDPNHPESRGIKSYSAGRVIRVDRPFGFTPAVGDAVVISRSYSLPPW
jgi:hypothetical protein